MSILKVFEAGNNHCWTCKDTWNIKVDKFVKLMFFYLLAFVQTIIQVFIYLIYRYQIIAKTLN